MGISPPYDGLPPLAVCRAEQKNGKDNNFQLVSHWVFSMSFKMTKVKARRALFTPSIPQPIATSSSPSSSKGRTAARNAAESYEASAGLYRYTLADYQSPSTTYGGAATAAGCNSPYLATMSSGPSKSNLYKE